MKKLIILYPKQFNCFEKFQRKVARIVANLTDYSVNYLADENKFIQRFFSELHPEVILSELTDIENVEISHGIIFDDGEEFKEETLLIEQTGIPLRLVKIKITRVINIKRQPEFVSGNSTKTYEYIGRGSYWGNPYSMYEEGDSREEVIRKYKYDFDYEKFINKEKSEVYKLAGKRLGCFCKPHCCHGDVLADYLNSWDDGK